MAEKDTFSSMKLKIAIHLFKMALAHAYPASIP
jgi:hypothetical protein